VKRNILMMLVTIYFMLPAAFRVTDFSGSWLRDNAKSDPAPNFMYWLTSMGGPMGGGARGPGGPGGPWGPGGPGGNTGPTAMVVQQSGESLWVTAPHTGVISKYSLNGKPFTVTMDTGVQKATVRASLQGETLVLETTEPFGGMPGNVTLQIKQVWSLSPDGKVLTISTTRTVPALEKNLKEVYTRQ
jgi:hypothetical protein